MTKLSFTVAQVEKAIGIPAAKWKGRCFEIASAMVRAKLVRGTPVYGHWIGPITRTSHFADRRTLGFTNHGWVLVDEPTQLIVDPTRWVFEDRAPYIFVGSGADTLPYDEGGNKLRAALNRPPPERQGPPAWDALDEPDVLAREPAFRRLRGEGARVLRCDRRGGPRCIAKLVTDFIATRLRVCTFSKRTKS